MTKRTKVVVLGGGYAGVIAANRVLQRDDVDVTLINRRASFVERIRLHQFIAGNDDAVVDYDSILADGVRLLVGEASRIDTAGRRVELATGASVDYDYLVYAVGSGNADPSVPGAAEHAYPIASYEEAQRLRPVIESTSADSTVTVVGGGPLGIEVAAELAEIGRKVRLVSGGKLGPYLHPKGRRSVAKRLAKLKVDVVEGAGTVVTAVTADSVTLGNGRVLRSDVTIWTAGFGVPDLARRSGLSTDALGRLLTDETLTSVDDQHVLAAGDSAAPSGMPFRMSCQAAGPLGAHAADTLLHRLAGEDPTPVAIGFFGQCISLGRKHGIFQFASSADVANKRRITGRTGAKVKAIICWGTVKQLKMEAKKPGAFHMPKKAIDHDRKNRLEAASVRAAA